GLVPRIAVLQRGTLRILCSGSTGWARQRCALRRAGCVWFVIITEPDRSEDKQKSATYANLVHVLFPWVLKPFAAEPTPSDVKSSGRSEEHTSELQSPCNLVCRLLLEKKKIEDTSYTHHTGAIAPVPLPSAPPRHSRQKLPS